MGADFRPTPAGQRVQRRAETTQGAGQAQSPPGLTPIWGTQRGALSSGTARLFCHQERQIGRIALSTLLSPGARTTGSPTRSSHSSKFHPQILHGEI